MSARHSLLPDEPESVNTEVEGHGLNKAGDGCKQPGMQTLTPGCQKLDPNNTANTNLIV